MRDHYLSARWTDTSHKVISLPNGALWLPGIAVPTVRRPGKDRDARDWISRRSVRKVRRRLMKRNKKMKALSSREFRAAIARGACGGGRGMQGT